MNIAIILAGGTGSRMGADKPKQFIEVLGKPIIQYTLEAFQRHPEVDVIEVVCIASHVEYMRELVNGAGVSKAKYICEGGPTFQESVMRGIESLKGRASDDDVVLIHYGASPFTSETVISDAIRVCREKGNASPAAPMLYLTARRSDCEKTTEWLDRDLVMRLNTPQALRYGYAVDLYERATRDGWLDRVDPHTVSLMLAMGEPVYFSLDESANIKITTPSDLRLFEGWILAGKQHAEGGAE
ncbi:2-C-methyl-D-erythritol 4-phosphate cytidylyltransferase [Collinsella tanakaei]|nr:2-C-methyl-D-erythritol 4-phosphate cytidylyltransferase [Collinsella tanakaei]